MYSPSIRREKNVIPSRSNTIFLRNIWMRVSGSPCSLLSELSPLSELSKLSKLFSLFSFL